MFTPWILVRSLRYIMTWWVCLLCEPRLGSRKTVLPQRALSPPCCPWTDPSPASTPPTTSSVNTSTGSMLYITCTTFNFTSDFSSYCYRSKWNIYGGLDLVLKTLVACFWVFVSASIQIPIQVYLVSFFLAVTWSAYMKYSSLPNC